MTLASLHHDPYQRLGPTGPHQHPTIITESLLHSLYRRPDAVGITETLLDSYVDVSQHLWKFDHHPAQLSKRSPGAGNDFQQTKPRQQTVAGGPIEQQNMPTLLTAETGTDTTHLLEDVPISDIGLDHVDSKAMHGDFEAEVRHHRGDHGVTG